MAALAKLLSNKQLSTKSNVILCCYATKAEKKKGIDRKVAPKIEFTAQSLAAKGFLRAQKDYTPPSDLIRRLDALVKSIVGTTDKSTKLETQKYPLLQKCSDEFQHSIPNSLLHTIDSVNDVYNFYQAAVDTTTPLDKLKQIDLPPNLHIQYEYNRFHPDTSTKFGGLTAFPRSSTLVTGLKYKEKYRGHTQNTTWPYNS